MNIRSGSMVLVIFLSLFGQIFPKSKKLSISIVESSNLNDSDSVFYAIMRKDTKTVKKWVKNHKKELDVVNESGHSLLSYAVSMNNASLVKFLLKAGCDVNQAVCSCKTALDIAVENDQFKIARMLLKWGGAVILDKNARTLKTKLKKRGRNFLIAKFLTDCDWLYLGAASSYADAMDVPVIKISETQKQLEIHDEK